MPTYTFKANTISYNETKIIKLPDDISDQLSSRGMNFAEIMIVMEKGNEKDNLPLTTQVPLEPDGNKSHWFYIPNILSERITQADVLDIELTPIEIWPTPSVPDDFIESLKSSHLYDYFYDLTPKAQWEWMRWIQMTNNPDTRKKRITASMDKMHKGMKRPCCFDQTRCTDYGICRNGVLKLTL